MLWARADADGLCASMPGSSELVVTAHRQRPGLSSSGPLGLDPCLGLPPGSVPLIPQGARHWVTHLSAHRCLSPLAAHAFGHPNCFTRCEFLGARVSSSQAVPRKHSNLLTPVSPMVAAIPIRECGMRESVGCWVTIRQRQQRHRVRQSIAACTATVKSPLASRSAPL